MNELCCKLNENYEHPLMNLISVNIGGKVFKSGLTKFCGRQRLVNLLSPLLNTLSHIKCLF